MEINEFKKLQAEKYLQNTYINNFVKNNSLGINDIMDNFTAFDLCYESLTKCENCPGLKLCPQAKKGERVELAADSFIHNEISYCKLYLDENRYQLFKKSYVYSDIPEDLYDLRLDKVQIEENSAANLFLQLANIFTESRKRGLYIYGDLGTGKTYLSIALSNSLVEAGKSVAFIKTNSFVTKMANYIKSDSDFYDNIISRISSADYVFFDDIGSEIVTAFSRDRLLMSILDYRMENRLCTVFTSNFDKKYLLRYYSGNQDSMNARRLIERIDILGEDFCLTGTNKRRKVL
ncbi:MAG: ATP-binding protein [Erysipelotrichaceae bacterium]